MDELWILWETQIICEIGNLKDRLDLLSSEHRQQIKSLQQNGHLPENIGDDLIAALFELSSDLQAVEFDLRGSGEFLLAKGRSLTEEELRSRADEYLNQILKGYQRELVRIRVKLE